MPAVTNTAVKIPVPLTKAPLPGTTPSATAKVSEDLKPTVPFKPVAVLLNWSSAVTVKLTALPALALLGAVLVIGVWIPGPLDQLLHHAAAVLTR